MQAGNEDFELKQMRDMAAAKKRWDALVLFKHHVFLVFVGLDKKKHEFWDSILVSLSQVFGEKRSDFIASIM